MIRTYKYGEITKDEIFARTEPTVNVEAVVAEIIETVKKDKDKALVAYSEKFDGVKLDALEVSREEIDEAFNSVDEKFIGILKSAYENIYAFHSRQVRNSFLINDKDGLYVPGGTAAYPSSVLMNCVPAKIAGCKEIVMVTPPSKDGKVNPHILAAAAVAGVDRVFKVGGAQAIAALAYGTESVTKVDKIVGPGNAFVAEAKKQVFGRVSIDMIAGPSEILVIADGTCNAKYVAADLLSQAEHDRMASAVLVTDSEKLAADVAKELERQLPLLEREEPPSILRYAWTSHLCILIRLRTQTLYSWENTVPRRLATTWQDLTTPYLRAVLQDFQAPCRLTTS